MLTESDASSGTFAAVSDKQALIGGLSSQALVRVRINGDASATEVGRYAMGERIREVEQGPDGTLWLLEDQADGTGGRLLQLTPKALAQK